MAEVSLGVHIHRGGRGRKAAEVGAGLTRKRRKRQRTKLRAWVQMRSAEKTEATKFMVSVEVWVNPPELWTLYSTGTFSNQKNSLHFAVIVPLTQPRWF